jgi:hypothetical protein
MWWRSEGFHCAGAEHSAAAAGAAHGGIGFWDIYCKVGPAWQAKRAAGRTAASVQPSAFIIRAVHGGCPRSAAAASVWLAPVPPTSHHTPSPPQPHTHAHTHSTHAHTSAHIQVVGTAMLWGMGTALGEVPPYAISFHAARAGKRSAEVEAMLGADTGSGRRGGESLSVSVGAGYLVPCAFDCRAACSLFAPVPPLPSPLPSTVQQQRHHGAWFAARPLQVGNS